MSRSFAEWCDGPMGNFSHWAVSNPVENPPRHQIHEFRWDDASQRFQEVGQAQASQTLTESQDDTHPKSRFPDRSKDPLGSLWDTRSNKTYTHRDVHVMYDALDHYFQNENQLRAAQDLYMNAVKIPGGSPVDAFRQAAMMSALARELDNRDAHRGGLIYHLESLRDFRDTFWPPGASSQDYRLSPDAVQDLRNAKALRKVQEIKKTMATNHLKNAGGPIMENLQFRPAISHETGAHARAEAAAVPSGDMKCEITDEVKNEDDVKDEAVDEVKSEDETVAEMRQGDHWVIVKPEDADAPDSG